MDYAFDIVSVLKPFSLNPLGFWGVAVQSLVLQGEKVKLWLEAFINLSFVVISVLDEIGFLTSIVEFLKW